MKSFKGAMAQFYGEQRAQVKGIKERSIVNKARNEAKRELEEAQSDAPLHAIRLDGRSCRLLRNDAQSYAQAQQEGLVPWGAQPDVLMDRYDVRALLDIYADPDPRVWRMRQRSAREVELEEQVSFEAFRDLIRLKCLGLSERQGVRHAEQENVAIRAAARAAAVAALEAGKTPKPLPSQHAAFASSTPAGTGQFAAVGFSYGGGGAASDDGDESAEEAEEEDDSDDDLPATAEDADMDRCALREFGIEEFSSMLRWAMRQEAEEAAANARRTRRNWSRKKARLRAKRLAGQGLDPTLYAKAPPKQGADISWIPERRPDDLAQMYMRRDSPDYEPMQHPRSPGGGRRTSDRPQPEFITSFGGGGGAEHGGGGGGGGGGSGGGGGGGRERGQLVRDAVPGAADPALEGPAMLPAAAFRLHGVRADGGRDAPRYGSVSGRDYSKSKKAAAPAVPTVVRAVDRSKETPAERLKRLMAAQLNKKIQKDTLTAAQKKQQEEAERRMRMANEAAAQEAERRDSGSLPQPPRDRDRDWERDASRRSSPSPDRHRRRSRSRSRERDRSSERRHRDGYRRRSRSRDRSWDRSRDRSRDRDRYRSSRRSPSPPRYHRR